MHNSVNGSEAAKAGDPAEGAASAPSMNAGVHAEPRAVGRFVTEGQFVALPLGMVDECEPIQDDAAYIERIVASPCGRWVSGVSGGTQRHVFTALFKAAAGGVLDLGVLEGEASVACLGHWPGGGRRGPALLIGINRGAGFELLRQTIPEVDDSIQEPGYGGRRRYPVARVEGAWLIDARVLDDDPWRIVCVTDQGVATVGLDPETREMTEVVWPCASGEAMWPTGADAIRMACAAERWVWPAGRAAVGWYEPAGGACGTVPLRTALPDEPVVAWASVEGMGLIAVMQGGGVWRIDVSDGGASESVRAPLGEVQCAAILPDGRVYAMCGADVAQFCRLEPARGVFEPLGAVASAMVGKRYGFNFADAAASDEGVAYFAEHDRGGHLWAYYPPAMPRV